MNIVLVGMPGSGKTAIGKLIAAELQREFLDVDEWIAATTGRDTSDHLAELGDNGFLDFECEISKQIQLANGVIATTGSNPLRADGINHLRKDSITIWMDVPLEIIEARVGKRKDGDTRIVGAQTMTFPEILAWRIKEYEKNHDLRFVVDREKPKAENAALLLQLLKNKNVC